MLDHQGTLRNKGQGHCTISVNSTVELCDSAEYKSKGRKQKENK